MIRTIILASVLATGPAMGMTYKDNAIDFPDSSDFQIVSGTFTISQKSITDGEDPDNKPSNQIGAVQSFQGSKNQLSYEVGRSGSTEVASWYSNLINADQNTFGHDASKLNFGFYGTLQITFTGAFFGSKSVIVSFDDIGFAQGSGNNWYFGGKNCKFTSNGYVNCSNSASDKIPVCATFQRGDGNNNNYVNVKNLYYRSGNSC